MSFEKLGLRQELLAGVKRQGYTVPTAIQKQAIPVVLQGRDILAGAQTGTGKTAAFALPLLHGLSHRERSSRKSPRALILTPTRELATQVGESIKVYGHGLNLSSTVIFGGVGAKPQVQRLRRGVDIVVGTPGRLLDLSDRKELDLSRIETLVLDEADRMLDMGFIHDIRKIIKLVPEKRQTLFFSATYSKEIKALADTILDHPELVEVARRNTAAEGVDQSVYRSSKAHKRQLLSYLIKQGDWDQVLVFTRTKHGANRLAKQLITDGISATAIHGNKSQAARTKSLANFKNGKVRVMVATDIASRGLDIDRLPHVVNYELPQVPEDYIHRIGRTGRAGCSGEAISLVMEDEVKLLRAIERLMKKQIPVNQAEGFVAVDRPVRSQGTTPRGPRPFQKRNNGPNSSRGGNSRRRSHSRRVPAAS